jgi:uncharacterized protein YukE
MGRGFSCSPSGLQAGSGEVAGLQEIWRGLGQNAIEALAAMAGSAGDADLASALTGAASRGDRGFTGLYAAYGHVSTSLTSCAATYSSADKKVAGMSGAVGYGIFPHGLK